MIISQEEANPINQPSMDINSAINILVPQNESSSTQVWA